MPSFDPKRLKAVLLDVDGTLYRQGPVRRGMLWRLLRHGLVRPGAGWRVVRALRAYRRAQESLRKEPVLSGDLAQTQLRLAASWTGTSADFIHQCVTRWMEQEPDDLVAAAVQVGMREFLQAAAERGWLLATVSDYPTSAKLAALGVAPWFTVQVCAQDAEVQAFKPHPRGLLVALERLGVAKEHALYVGDRPEVDATAAARAGIACAILGRRHAAGHSWFGVSGYQELRDVVCG